MSQQTWEELIKKRPWRNGARNVYMRVQMDSCLVWHMIEEVSAARKKMDQIFVVIFTSANAYYLLTKQRKTDTLISGEHMFS